MINVFSKTAAVGDLRYYRPEHRLIFQAIVDTCNKNVLSITDYEYTTARVNTCKAAEITADLESAKTIVAGVFDHTQKIMNSQGL